MVVILSKFSPKQVSSSFLLHWHITSEDTGKLCAVDECAQCFYATLRFKDEESSTWILPRSTLDGFSHHRIEGGRVALFQEFQPQILDSPHNFERSLCSSVANRASKMAVLCPFDN